MKIRLENNLQFSKELEFYFQQTANNSSDFEKRTCGRWTSEEHKKFIEGLMKFGKNWKKVEEHIGTRTGAQIRSHAQKFFKRLEREYKKRVSSIENDENRKRSDSFATQNSIDYMYEEEEKTLDENSQLLCSKLTNITEAKIETMNNGPQSEEEMQKLQKMLQLLSAYDNLLPPCQISTIPNSSDESLFRKRLEKKESKPKLSDIVEMDCYSSNEDPRSRKSSFKLYDEEDEMNLVKAENFRKKCKKDSSCN